MPFQIKGNDGSCRGLGSEDMACFLGTGFLACQSLTALRTLLEYWGVFSVLLLLEFWGFDERMVEVE